MIMTILAMPTITPRVPAPITRVTTMPATIMAITATPGMHTIIAMTIMITSKGIRTGWGTPIAIP